MSSLDRKSSNGNREQAGLRAPLLPAAIAVMVGVVTSECCGPTAMWPAGLLFAIACGAIIAAKSLSRGGPLWTHVALICVAAVALGIWRHQAATQLPNDHVAHVAIDEPVLTRLSGQIVSSPTALAPQRRNPFIPFDPPPQARFVLATDSITVGSAEQPLSGTVRVTIDSPSGDLRLGDRLRVAGKLYRPRSPRNPGETDWALQMRLQGIHAGMAVESSAHAQQLPSGGSALAAVDRGRAWARSLLFEPSVAAEHSPAVRVLDSMVLGQRSAVGQEINDAFLRTGVIHFLSVSGAHVAALAGSVYWLLRRVLHCGAKPTAVASMLTMLAYLLLAEPNAPILRATLMGVCICVAMLIDRPIAPLNWLALAALLVLARPLDLFQAGFQLSFVQVAVMIVALPRLVSATRIGPARDRPAEAATCRAVAWATTRRWFHTAAMTSALCWVASIPLSLHHFRMFTPWAALHSLILTPLIVAITLLSFVAMLIRALTLGAITIVNDLVMWLTDWLLLAVDWLASWPGTLMEFSAPPLLFVFAVYVGVCWAMRWFAQRRCGALDERDPRAGGVHQLTFAAAIPVLAWLPGLVASNVGGASAEVVVLSVGSGSAAIVMDESRRVALIDAGTIHNFDAGRTIVDALRELRASRVEWASISHDNFDHYSGVPTLFRRGYAQQFMTTRSFAESLNRAESREPLARELGERRPVFAGRGVGDRASLGACEFEVLWPPDDLPVATDENDRSLVLRLRVGERTILLPGDIEQFAIRGLLDAYERGRIDLRCDVLVAPHHGSVVAGATAALLAAVSPEVVIVSTSKDRTELVALVSTTLGKSCRVLSTEELGAVTVRVMRDGRLGVTGFVGR
ncbi:MAG: ComEC/Rec2 family competence protein [Phycisphaerae bacterium]